MITAEADLQHDLGVEVQGGELPNGGGSAEQEAGASDAGDLQEHLE